MLKTQESVENSAKAREGLAEEIRAVGMCGDGKGNRVHVFRAALADWARRVEECEWGSGVLMAPRDRNDVPLLLGDFVRRKKDGVTGEVRRISFRKERDVHTTTVEIYTTRLGTVFCAPCDLEHASASPQECIREWVRRANADEHMDLRELDALADRIDKELVELPRDRDGVPIHVGDTVWGCISGMQMAVHECRMTDRWTISTDEGFIPKASAVTHVRPDSWERIAYDIETVVPIDDEGYERLRHELADRIRRLAAEEGE